MTPKICLFALAAALVSKQALAEDLAETGTTAADASASVPADDNKDIVVTAHRRRTDDVLGDVKVLSGAELLATVRPTIGATLASQPGVSTTGSGPNVSKPVLRGLSGDRIRTLVDGIGSLDVSASSSDHAVAINPLTAQSIEVLHGPASLVFGSSAVGGVVNVIDSRIPRAVPDDGVKAKGLLGYGTAANERLASGAVDVGLGAHLVAHGDVSWTRNDDLRIGGHVLAKPLRDAALASGDPDIQALADLKGKLPNSDGRTFEAAGALAYVDGDLNIGASVSRRTANYGVPVRYSLDPAIEAEDTHIDVHQTRYDARAEIPLDGFLKKVRLRGGYSNYRHAEIGADGDIGSQVYSKGGDARLDLDQRDTADGWGGASGVQYFNVRQHIDGDEQYLPPVQQQSVGLFTVQHIEKGPLRVEAGARFEHSKATADANIVTDNPNLNRSFSTLSLSAGGRYTLSRAWSLGLNLTRSQRAPSAEELYANGPHGGNASFEVGDPNLKTERSVGVEATLKHSSDAFDGSVTFYASRYASFIYQAPTGMIEDDLPVYETRQGRARYRGFEAEAHVPLGSAGGIEWEAEGTADATFATIRGFGPAPLIPPLRVQGALVGKAGPVGGRLEVEHAWQQNRNATNELETPAYTLVNASLDWKPFDRRPDLTVSLAANNIFDVTVRHATSLLKDYAPAAGRDVRLTLSFDY
ncbi:TonB-dependent receptor [Sphingomonas jaspsi]|uniref:TonB-dependent receptor n=1 Tax=Sphingomonas jaspsi TaxID=392409 RepID=UPI0005624F8B|nr:TonB-dependent receptor [Sphingomonas jaspsi]